MKTLDIPVNEQIVIKDKPEPQPQKGHAIVSVAYTGICGSDMHVYLGHGPKVKPPIKFTLGHESSGVIDFIDPVHGLKRGDRVAINPLIGCNQCAHCKQGLPNLCVDRTVMGFQQDGTFAEKVVVPIENIIPIGDLDLKLGAFIEPVTVAVHAVLKGKPIFQTSENIFVIGGGTIGILCALVCQKLNPSKKIVVIEIAEDRRALIESLGFKTYSSLDILGQQQQPYTCMECTGSAKVFSSLLEINPAPKGIQIVSVFPRTAELELFWLIKHEIIINSSQMYTKDDFFIARDILKDIAFSEKLLSIIDPTKFTLDNVAEAFKHQLKALKYPKILVSID